MSQYQGELHSVYLKPGEIFIGAKPTAVTTILGSCVSVVFFNRRRQLGAICHALLPSGTKEDGSKYVDYSIRLILDEYKKHGINLREIEVKLFGGSDMFSFPSPSYCMTVGQQNIQKALEVIRAEGLNLVASDVGGKRSRKIVFYVHSGEVLLKYHDRRESGDLNDEDVA